MGNRAPSILFVNQHYHPDVASTGQHLADLCEHLADAGFRVSVLCARGRYGSESVGAPKREIRNGVRVRRVAVTRFGRGRHVGRILDYAGFFAQVVARVLFGPRHDRVVFLTTPPLLPSVGLLLRTLRGRRYGIWCMDLHPDAEIALGMLGDGHPITRVLQAVDRSAVRNAEFVVALGDCMRRKLLAKGIRGDRIVTIPVWSRADEVRPIDRSENPLAAKLGLNGAFVVMYSGNAGLAHRFQEILEVMDRLREDERFQFLFVGGGPRRKEIESFARARGIRNFQYLEYLPREEIKYSLPLADVHLVSMRPEMSGLVVPGKLYGAMAAARPVVFVGPSDSDVARTVLEAGCGEVIDPGQGNTAQRLEGALVALRRDAARAAALGQRGRRSLLERYDRVPGCERWRALLDWKLAEPAA